jgi:hypothetical protein
MATVDDALRAQVRNIEATYGRTMADWAAVISSSALTKHAEIVAMLKAEHGLRHAAAHRVSLVVRGGPRPVLDPAGKTDDVNGLDWLFGPRSRGLQPIGERIIEAVRGFGGGIDLAAKKGYVSIRRRKQFAMLKPGARELNVGLVLEGARTTSRLESAATFNALFTHRVRLRRIEEVDALLVRWMRAAYDAAG